MIVAVDPGKTCGVARLWVCETCGGVGHRRNARGNFEYSRCPSCNGGHQFDSREADRWETLDLIDEVGNACEGVVCESFVPRPGVRSWQPDALEIIGALRYICHRAGIPFETQAPADAKRFATNDKLETCGWRNPTRGGHADDASRHLLLAAVRRGLIDPAIFARLATTT